MQLKKYLTAVTLGVSCIFLNACVSNSSPSETLSKRKNAELYLQMGVRYLDMNMLKIAKEKLDAALDLDSQNDEVHNSLGVMHERLNQAAQAEQHYQQALSINMENSSIKNNYGRFLCERGKYEEGLQFLKQAVAMPLNNRKWFAYTNIGRCELTKEEHTLAEANFRQALQYNNQYSPALFELQKLSYKQRKYLSARAFLERYLSVSKHTPETLWYAVQTERALGNKSLVEQYRDQLFSWFPASKEAQQLKTAVKLN